MLGFIALAAFSVMGALLGVKHVVCKTPQRLALTAGIGLLIVLWWVAVGKGI